MSVAKFNIDHLLELCRIKISAQEKESLEKDLLKILEYVEMLDKIDTSKVSQQDLKSHKNVLRSDSAEIFKTAPLSLIDQFLESENNYLKIPPIFDHD